MTRIAPGAETGGLPAEALLLTSIFCLRRELGACLRTPEGAALKGPLILTDEKGGAVRFEFDCAACRMRIHLLETPAHRR